VSGHVAPANSVQALCARRRRIRNELRAFPAGHIPGSFCPLFNSRRSNHEIWPRRCGGVGPLIQDTSASDTGSVGCCHTGSLVGAPKTPEKKTGRKQLTSKHDPFNTPAILIE